MIGTIKINGTEISGLGLNGSYARIVKRAGVLIYIKKPSISAERPTETSTTVNLSTSGNASGITLQYKFYTSSTSTGTKTLVIQIASSTGSASTAYTNPSAGYYWVEIVESTTGIQSSMSNSSYVSAKSSGGCGIHCTSNSSDVCGDRYCTTSIYGAQ